MSLREANSHGSSQGHEGYLRKKNYGVFEYGNGCLPERRDHTESKKPGRDHNPHCFTTWMAGGGIKGGVSFGESDEIGHPAARDKSHVNDIQANILHQLGFNHEKLTYEYNGRRFRLTDVGDKVITPSLT